MSDLTVASTTPLRVVDFHSHFVGPSFALTTHVGLPPPLRSFWEGVNRVLVDPDALVASLDGCAIAARVINTPLQFLQDADGNVPPDTVPRINDAVADLVSRHPGRLFGLATVDAFSGETGAREVTRAVAELGLRGVFVECAKGPHLPDAKEARPTLAAAAALGVPVFLHPVADPQLFGRFKPYGPLGMRLTRGTINSAALLAMLAGGTFDELPNLRVVVTALALGGALLAGGFGDGCGLRKDTPASVRRHVYVDTMGLHPATVRCAVDLVGADHVLAGTDWPIAVEPSVPERLGAALAGAGLAAAEQQMVASGNALALLGAG